MIELGPGVCVEWEKKNGLWGGRRMVSEGFEG